MNRSTFRLSSLALAVLGSACAQLPATPAGKAPPPAGAVAAASPAPAAALPPSPGASAAAAAPGARPTAPAARPPGAPTPFADVVKDAKRQDGFLPLWTRDDKTWLEIPADRLDQPFFFGNSLASGLGSGYLLPGLTGPEHVVVLRRVGNAVQLVARTRHARAPAGTPLARAVADSYSDSLLSAVPLAAAPHPQSKALLVDAMALLGGDLMGLQSALERSYRLPYGLDRGNSSIERASTDAGSLRLTLRQHFAVPKIPLPPVATPGAPPPNPALLPRPPQHLPDARSLFLNVAYVLAPLPAEPMRARKADPRVGFFTVPYLDFGDEMSEGRRAHLVERWRLEKKDPTAAISEPRVPIRVVMDRNIPERWRPALREGALAWNAAFERAGFRNAVVVEQQPADAEADSVEGLGHIALRWFAIDGPGALAVGPSQSDPRTGQILRAAAIIPENWVRLTRRRSADAEPRLAEAADGGGGAPLAGEFATRYASCTYAAQMAEHTAFGIELLAARGAFAPYGPEVDRLIEQDLKAVTMHEIGHTLGLRHNFRASTTVSQAQLRDPKLSAERGIASSVMDYTPLNLSLPDEPVAAFFQTTPGPYDLWAIEYGYREFPPEREAEELAQLAGRAATDPLLAYATDEDLGNQDPSINHFDLGPDPLAFVDRQSRLVAELWQNAQRRSVAAGDDYTVNRRNLQRGFALIGQTLPIALKYVGGVDTQRTLAGSGQALLTPVPAERQRQALDLVVRQVFEPQAFRFDPRFMSRLGVDQLERLFTARGSSVDFSVAASVAGLQRTALDTLMADGLAQRLADAETKVADPSTLLSFAEVQQRLRQATWRELDARPAAKAKRAGQIDALRRNLQREHLRRLASALLRPLPSATADVRAVQRQQAQALQAQLKAAVAPGATWTPMARAHLEDSLATLTEALQAPMNRAGV